LYYQSTAIQYLRRFYLFNSPMTYHVNTILRTIMFMATKIELFNIHVSEYAQGAGRNVTTESILAPEYIIMLGLRYNLDVRHPFRALKAGHMEMLEMAHGKYQGPGQGMSAKEVQAKISNLPVKAGGHGVKMPEKKVEERIHAAYGTTSNTLRTIAVLTDAYFLYTPSQIWLSAHLLADEPLLPIPQNLALLPDSRQTPRHPAVLRHPHLVAPSLYQPYPPKRRARQAGSSTPSRG
jgi:cyclin H